MDCIIYRQLIGSLLYLTHSRPDICYAVNAISRYMQKPHDIHWKESKRILQYIQGTRTYNIDYATDFELELVGYTDSDWVGDSIDWKSTSGYVFMFGGGPIFWSRKIQAAIALSSVEAKYRGAVNACIQAIWLQGILSEFDLGSTFFTILFCENQSSINISTDPDTEKRTKHVEIHMHYIRELVHDMTIILQHCPTGEKITDIFTKRFLENKFTYFHSLLGVSSSR